MGVGQLGPERKFPESSMKKKEKEVIKAACAVGVRK